MISIDIKLYSFKFIYLFKKWEENTDKNTEEKKDTDPEQEKPAEKKLEGGEKKGGKIDLAALAAKANALNKK